MQPPHAVQNRLLQKNKHMKTLVSILMTILGILSPTLSSQAQEADLFPGEFKEIYSINDFTEGYYLIVIPSSDRTDEKSQLIALSGVQKKGKSFCGESTIISSPSKPVNATQTTISDPYTSVVWKVERTNDGKFTLQNCSGKKYIKSQNPHNTLNIADTPDGGLSIVPYNVPTNDYGNRFTLKGANNWLVFHFHTIPKAFVFSGKGNVPTRGTHSPRFFKLVAPETNQLTISSVKCATFYSEKAMKLPAGLTAHVGEVDAQHGVVHLKAIGSVVPANTAVIITGEPGTYTPTVTTEAPQTFAKNDLKGTSKNITASEIAAAPEAYYALSINQGQPCFGILERDLPAGKAYFTQPKSAGAVSQFLSGFVISSVQQVQQKAEEGTLYDLNGRAVTQPVKGNIYVRNGKKFIYLR